MPTRTAHAEWNGDLKQGTGSVKVGSGTFEQPYSFDSRFGDKGGTNPEELIGAAHAGCFTMALSKALSDAGHPPERIRTDASVNLAKQNGGFAIGEIKLSTKARIPGYDEASFRRLAEQAKAGCPVSKALAGTKITLEAQLE